MALSLRTKLILVSTILMVIILIVLYFTILWLFSSNLQRGLNDELVSDVSLVKQLIGFTEAGNIDLFNKPERVAVALSYQKGVSYLVRDAKMRPVLRSANMIRIELPRPELLPQQQTRIQNIEFAGRGYRMLTQRHLYKTGAEPVYIQVVRPLSIYHKDVYRLKNAMYLITPIPIILVLIGSWWLVSRSLKPLNTLMHKLNAIGADDLHTRVAIDSDDEVGSLAATFNTFMDRVEQSFNSLKRFTADASHELRTPLTAMRTQSEIVLSRTRGPEEYRSAIGSLLEDITRLEGLTESLLQLTRGDAGITKANFKLENLSALLTKWVEYLSPLAEEKNIVLDCQIEPNVQWKLDAAIIERCIVNLLQNAINFSPVSGLIVVKLRKLPGRVEITVCDNGPGIPDAEKRNVFDRFVRLDRTRHASSGSGLGLAISRWAAVMHNGTLTVTDNQPQGCCFSLTLLAGNNNVPGDS